MDCERVRAKQALFTPPEGHPILTTIAALRSTQRLSSNGYDAIQMDDKLARCRSCPVYVFRTCSADTA